jgi:peptidyl-prolyl cis-trans isomerase C
MITGRWIAGGAGAVALWGALAVSGLAGAQTATESTGAEGSSKGGETPGQGKGASHQASQDNPGDKARRARVIARVGDVKITVGEVEDAINKQSPFLRSRYKHPERLKEFVGNMIRFELLAKEAKRRGYDENPAVVRSLKQNAVQRLIRREFDEKITPKTVPTEAVRGYYESHEEEFSRPEQVRAAHILVKTKKEAKALLEEAKEADIRGFRELAREHSIDTETKHRGGDLRYFTREGRPPGSKDVPVDEALVEAAFSLEEVGDVTSEPVPVGDHFSIVKLIGHRPAEHDSLEEAEKRIRLRLWRERRQQAIEDFVDKLRKRFEPKVFDERMAPIELDPGEAAEGFAAEDEAAAKDEVDPSQAGPAGGQSQATKAGSAARSAGKGSNPEGSNTQGSSAEGSAAPGSKAESSGAQGSERSP